MMDNLKYLEEVVDKLNGIFLRNGRPLDWRAYRVKFKDGVTEQNIRNASEYVMRNIKIGKSLNSITGYIPFNGLEKFLSNLENVEKVGDLNDPSTY